MDRIDLKILKELADDGRLSNRKLAERVGISPTPCLARVRKLEESGVIEGYRAQLSETRLGYALRILVFVRLERQQEALLDRFEEAVAAFDEVTDCYIISGESDYLLRVVMRDLDEFDNFLTRKLSRLDGVASISSNFVLRHVLHRQCPL